MNLSASVWRWRALAIAAAMVLSHTLPAHAQGEPDGQGAAAGQDPQGPQDAQVSGFVTDWTGELTGRVTTLDGQPLRDEAVHVATAKGEQIVKTDGEGRYRAQLVGVGAKMVFVRRQARIIGQNGVSTIEGGEEVLLIEETMPPKVMPRNLGSTRRVLRYSDEARAADVWLKAWLILDVDERGAVQRVKLIQRPGYGLDEVAIQAAFAERFAPAQDQRGRAVSTMMLWSYEWPAYWWMSEHARKLDELPAEVAEVGCRTQPGSTHLRDCAPPDLGRGYFLPWQDPPTSRAQAQGSAPATAACAAAGAGRPDLARRWYRDGTGWALTGAGAALLVTAGYLVTGSEDQELAGLTLGVVAVPLLIVGTARLAIRHDRGATGLTLAGQF